jgi:hypothetical protein
VTRTGRAFRYQARISSGMPRLSMAATYTFAEGEPV